MEEFEFDFNKIEKRVVPRYTLSAWKKLGLGDEDDWELEMAPKKMYDFVLGEEIKETEKLGHPAAFVLKVVAVDDEYFRWADKKRLEYSEKTVAKYIQTVDYDNAVRLLGKNHMNIQRILGNILVFANVPEDMETMDIRLSDDAIAKIYNVLENEYGFYESLIVPGIVLLPDEVLDCSFDLDDYEKEKEKLKKEKTLPKDIKGLDRPVPLLIPFIIDAYIEGCECSVVLEMLEYCAQKDFIAYAEDDDAYYEASKEFNNNPMCQAIKRDWNLDDFYVVPEGIDFLSSEDYIQEFLSQVEEED